jgi:hypothetical protein
MPTIRVFCCAFPQPFCHLGSRMSYLRIKPGPQNISERVAFAQFCVPLPAPPDQNPIQIP